MKKTLLLTLFCGATYLTLVSYSEGPNFGGAGNRTGGPGSTGSCSQTNCHGSVSSNTHINVVLKDKATGATVNDDKYAPLRTYLVEVTVHNNSFNHFGFQAEVLDANNNSTGVLTALSGHRTGNANGKRIIEHSAPISGSTTTFEWISPHAGAGAVTFYLNGNAVNNDDDPGGDEPGAPYSITLTENNTSVATVKNDIEVIAYPNPVTDQLNIKLQEASRGAYIINAYSLNGSKLFEDKVQINSATYETSLQTDKWAAGIYYVQIIKDGIKHITTVVKK